jgi:MFS family permease
MQNRLKKYEGKCAGRNKKMTVKSPWLAFLGLLFGSFFVTEALAFQIPALPVLTQEFGIPVALSGLISLFYYLTHTVFGPIFGNFADQVGRKRIVMIGLVIFTISEYAAALSPNFSFFLGARFLQGIGAACVVPAGIAYATYLFPGNKRGLALGVLAAIGTLGAAAGGIIGGLVIGKFGWQSIYVISGTLSLIGILVVKVFVPETAKATRKPFDYLGSVLLLVAVGTLLSVTTLIANLGISSPYTLTALVLGIILAVCFWIVEKKSSHPFIDLSLLKNRKFILPLALVFFMGLCYQAILYTNAFFVSTKPGGGPALAGMLTMYIYVAGAISGLIGGKLVDIFKIKYVMISGIVIFAAGSIIYSTYNVNTPFWYVVMTVLILAVGVTLIGPAAMKMAMSVVSESKLSSGSGTYVLIRDLGTPTGQTTGLATFGALSVSSMAAALTAQAHSAGISDKLIPAVQQAGKTAGQTIDSSLADQLSKLGVNFQDLLGAAKLDGMIQALNSMSHIVIGVVIALFLAAFFLPNMGGGKVSEERIEIGEIPNQEPTEVL